MTPHDVHLAWKAGREIAVIDLREEHLHAVGHPLFATCLALSRLELGIFDLIPRRDTPIVLFDEDGSMVEAGRARLQAWGYRHVDVLEGGLPAWQAAGLELFADVNSPSKAFGELVEHRRGTPYVTAEQLHGLIADNADLVVMDARRFDEYQTMSVPGAVSVPGAELVLRARALAPDPETMIVVNCAGRTRSIVGTQSLINAGLPNPVRALRNGTIGWTLDGLSLATGQSEQAGIDEGGEADALRRARAVSYRAGVKRVDHSDLGSLVDPACTLYRFDVRSEAEYLAGHPEGFRWMQGGQLVQEVDMVAAVRGAQILLFDDRGVRAHMTASWLAQMGWDCFVVEDCPADALRTGPWRPNEPAPEASATIAPADVAARLGDMLVLDLASSTVHAKGHLPGARFIMRGRLGSDLPAEAQARSILLVSPDDRLARHAAGELRQAGCADVTVLAGGTQAWRAAGLPIETGMSDPLSPAQDVYRRPYEGLDNPREKMSAYLEWEYGLVAQLERDGSHGFIVI